MTGPGPDRRPLVVGLGDPSRGDDAVGPRVARTVATLHLPGVSVAEHREPADLLHLWHDHHPVVVVDAVRSGAPAGTVHRLAVTGPGAAPGDPPQPAASGADTSAAELPGPHPSAGAGAGTHAVGLADVLRLARILDRMPSRLVVVGVEVASCDLGDPLSAPVAAAVPDAVEAVLAILHDA